MTIPFMYTGKPHFDVCNNKILDMHFRLISLLKCKIDNEHTQSMNTMYANQYSFIDNISLAYMSFNKWYFTADIFN